MNMKYDLFCYATRNAKMNLSNDDIKEYKKKYTAFLNVLWDYIDNPKKSYKGSKTGPSYKDPDSRDSSKKRINPIFYSDLCDFLNHTKGNKKYTYASNDEYINCEGDIKLFSDQFGFSRPSLDLKHPYDVYLMKCKIEKRDKDEVIENVINWVMESRTIGGSFIWPKVIGEEYNKKRGGTNPFNKKGEYIKKDYPNFYIEDRVDLTLCEIKHYLDNENFKGDIFAEIIKKDSREEKWIKSFGNFKGYIDYFCFDPFVVFVNEEKGYMPCDIIKSDIVNNKKIPIDERKIDYKNRNENSIFHFKLTSKDLERIFNNVNAMIKERSERIMERMNDEGKTKN